MYDIHSLKDFTAPRIPARATPILEAHCMRPLHRVPGTRLPVLFSTLLAALLSGGCMSVPQAGPAFRYYSARQKASPTIVSDHKRLSASRVRAVMKMLQPGSSAADSLERHMALEEAISSHPLRAGNRVTLLVNRAATYAAIFKAIRDARKNVNVETYILSADKAGYEFAELLMKKASSGVQVHLIYDSIGSMCTPPAFFNRLTSAGVAVLPFNPPTPLSTLPLPCPWSMVHRDHRKLVTVDDRVAFIGSANISDRCAKTGGPLPGLGGGKLPWRDTDIQIEGPAAHSFQKLFCDTWKKQHGPPIAEQDNSEFKKPAGDDLVRVVGSTWGEKNRDNYFAYLAAINSAQRSIHLTCSYFVPDQQLVEALTGAARRGVDVRIILPHRSDVPLAQYGSRCYYGLLLRSGIKLYERKDVILHSKSAVIDGVWSTVGSDNMDLWSILRNNELNAVILGRDFAAKMEKLFQKDLQNSDRITPRNWKRRSIPERFMEMLTAPLAYWL